MSILEEIIDDIENLFLVDPEEVSFLTGLALEIDNLIEQLIDEPIVKD